MSSIDLYGLHNAIQLPGIEGSERIGCDQSAQVQWIAKKCTQSLLQFSSNAHCNWDIIPSLEDALRLTASSATPTESDRLLRLAVIQRLRDLARSGIDYKKGLDLTGYGSFVSGLYTPAGDLDLCITGVTTWQEYEYGEFTSGHCRNMPRHVQAKLLNALANRLNRMGATDIIRLTHPRVRIPIIKFRDFPSSVEVDIAIGGNASLFKSVLVGLLQHFDWRVGALIRLVKLWARHHNINDASLGTLNSFALTLMVVFHLQTREPAVLPSISELFTVTTEAGRVEKPSSRPLEDGCTEDLSQLKLVIENLRRLRQEYEPNSETLFELLSSFFILFDTIINQGWLSSDEPLARVLRTVRVSTWEGCFLNGQWPVKPDLMLFSIEDPFDSTDNCTRTVREAGNANMIALAFSKAAKAFMMNIRSKEDIRKTMWQLFGPAAYDLYAMKDATPVPPIPISELWLPDSVYSLSMMLGEPYCSTVDHTKQRGLHGKARPTTSMLEQQLERTYQCMEGLLEVQQARIDVERDQKRTEEEARKAAKALKLAEKAKKKAEAIAAKRENKIRVTEGILHQNQQATGRELPRQDATGHTSSHTSNASRNNKCTAVSSRGERPSKVYAPLPTRRQDVGKQRKRAVSESATTLEKDSSLPSAMKGMSINTQDMLGAEHGGATVKPEELQGMGSDETQTRKTRRYRAPARGRAPRIATNNI